MNIEHKSTEPGPTPLKPKPALLSEPVAIDAYCCGERWIVDNPDLLARLVAIIAMGQAVHAAEIVRELQPAAPASIHKSLYDAARQQLRIVGKTQARQEAFRWQRDGFLFEVISWVAALQSSHANAYLKAPHLKSTTQGLDGLMIEMNAAKTEVSRATIFEDKCSDNPRDKFRDEVLKTFHDHHHNKRAPELISTAAALIEQCGLRGKDAISAASRVLDLAYRRYRAALTIANADDKLHRRKAIFKGYEQLDFIGQQQRVGATLVEDGDLRDYFDTVADRAIVVLNGWEKGIA